MPIQTEHRITALEENYKKIIDMFDDIKKDSLEIKVHVASTNGRVKKLELWRSYIAGGMSVVILLLVPIAIKYVSNIVLAWK